MSLGHGARIVRDGLVLHLDAANVKSYPGSGTVWRDLSNQKNNMTLYNNLAFIAENNGAFLFDGTDDYVQGSFTNTVNPNNSGCSYTLIAKSSINYTEYGNYRNLTYFTSSDASTHFGLLVEPDTRGLRFDWPSSINTRIGVTTNYVVGTNIFYVTYTWKNSVSKIYINDTLLSQTTHGSYTSASITGFRISNFGPRWPGYVYAYLFYDRELSDQEIKQNFESLRGRYGI